MGLDITLYGYDQHSDNLRKIDEEFLGEFTRHFGDKIEDVENQYIDWKKTFEKRNLNADDYYQMVFSRNEIKFKLNKPGKKEEQIFTEADLHLFPRMDKVLRVSEVGYQRKGMIGTHFHLVSNCKPIFDMKTVEKLLEHVEPDVKSHFKESILDRFIEGETFLIFWW